MKCCVIFAIVVLAVLVADASAAPPRARQLYRRPQRVFMVPRYALRRSWQETPESVPAAEDVFVGDDSQLGVIDVGAPLISEDPAEFDAPSAAIEEFAPEPVAADPTEVSAPEETGDEEAVVPAAKGSKRPAPQPHVYFPMSFGRTSGGSIAVANSYSTGKGNAVSHAVSYGNGKHRDV